MIQINGLILVGAILVLFAIASSKFSTRMGMPVLVVFIALGILGGSEGVGGIEFENYSLANGIGTVALALILFDGGFRTSMDSIRVAWGPALALATVGVLVTSLVTGLATAWIFGTSVLGGILLGSIVGSTDAAAVFAVLRSKGVRLQERLSATLEVESGANDPMAIFLTVGILGVLTGDVQPGLPLLSLFVLQMSVGALAGVGIGGLGVAINNRIRLDAAGLYPVMMVAIGFLAFGLAAVLGGSGFLAVYVAGIVLGNSRIVYKPGIALFTDGMAWLAQIVMFTMLGLLSFPSRVFAAAPQGLAVAFVLIFVARPLAVVAVAPFFRFNRRETALISWVGLRGSVPIILATYPLLAGLPDGGQIFDVVFFVVLTSAMAQGWTLPWIARRLGLEGPAAPERVVTLELTSLRELASDIVDYLVGPGSRAAGRRIRELSLPDGAVVAMLVRGTEVIPPRGSTRLEEGDHAYLVLRPEVRALVDRVFASGGAADDKPLPAVEFPLAGHTRVRDVVEFYGIQVPDAPPEATLEELLRSRHGGGPVPVGAVVDLGSVRLVAREVSPEGVEVVSLAVDLPPE